MTPTFPKPATYHIYTADGRHLVFAQHERMEVVLLPDNDDPRLRVREYGPADCDPGEWIRVVGRGAIEGREIDLALVIANERRT